MYEILVTNFSFAKKILIFTFGPHSVLYKQRSFEDEPSVLLDLNELSPDGTLSLSRYEFSNDGNLLGYGVSKSGSDWNELKVRDVESGQDHPETLQHVKFTDISWTHDNKGFFYSVSIACNSWVKSIIECFSCCCCC